MNDKMQGHLCALFTAIVWGCTFVSSKVLLQQFTSVEILFIRFVMGLIVLLILCPHPLKWMGWKTERLFMGAGLCGITIYYLLENIALTLTEASIVSIVTSMAPLFTGILTVLFLKSEKLGKLFVVGFASAIVGIILINVAGTKVQIEPKGTILAILAALGWGFYSIQVRMIQNKGIKTLQMTQRLFMYGLIFMIPALSFLDFRIDCLKGLTPIYLGNFLFLGLLASAICFITWNHALGKLGAVSASVYIYLMPVITVIASILILHEQLTVAFAIGTALVLAGLVLSEWKSKK